MFGMEAVVIAALFAGIVALVGAVTASIVSIVGVFRQNARDHAAVANKLDDAKRAALETKDVASTGVDDIRRDITVIAEGMKVVSDRFDAVDKRLNGFDDTHHKLSENQDVLLSMMANVEAKLPKKVSIKKDSSAPITIPTMDTHGHTIPSVVHIETAH